MKLRLDMNLSPRWAEVLQQAGHDAVHWSVGGSAEAEDGELMAWAAITVDERRERARLLPIRVRGGEPTS